MAERYTIRVESIETGERHRALSGDAVQRLAGSMKEIGLQHPITVRIVEEMEIDGEVVCGVPVLVAGGHRLAAAKLLGWSHVDCVEVDDDALKAELWEIDENLMRAELTAAQEAEHLARRKRVWKEINSGKTLATNRGRPKEFAADTATAIGQTKSSINAKIAVANKLGPDLTLVAGTTLDKGTELAALARMPEPERHALATRAAAGESVSAITVVDVDAQQFKALMGAWNRAGAVARELFLAEIDTPVFDRSAAA